MLGRPKITLGLTLLAITFLLVVIASVPKKSSRSTFELTAQKNRFKFSFNISEKDTSNFQKLLEKLALPQSAAYGIEFELDSTPSAMLDFAAPIKGTQVVTSKSLEIKGEITNSAAAQTDAFQRFSFPQDLNFALSAVGLQDAAKIYLDLPPDLAQSIAQNSAFGPQYLATFGNSSIYIFKTGTFDITTVKDSGEGYKEEVLDSVNVYILTKVTAFEIGQWTYIASSLDAAKAVINTQKDPKNSIDFPNSEKGNFALLFINSPNYPAPESLLIKIFGSKAKIPKSIEQISKIEFTLKDTTFSGLIDLK